MIDLAQIERDARAVAGGSVEPGEFIADTVRRMCGHLADMAGVARALSEALLMTWRPIATAPCGDNWALVCWKDGAITVEDLDHDSDPAWWAERGATHWMPCPEPPCSTSPTP